MNLVHDRRKAGCWLKCQLASILVPISLHCNQKSTDSSGCIAARLTSTSYTRPYIECLLSLHPCECRAVMAMTAITVPLICNTKVSAMQQLYPGANNVHAMAAGIVQLLQLHKALHLFAAPATDDGCRK